MHSPDRYAPHGDVLLDIARRSIEHGLVYRESLPVRRDELPHELAEPAATFTTLRMEGELRGCCGTLDAAFPLAVDVARSSFRAAFRDPRFDPVTAGELGIIRLEVSVLSPPQALPVADEADLLDQLVPGTDGLVIDADGHRATFLPKVWEMLPDPHSFLAALKDKCGLPADYWSDALRFERYYTTTFSEPDPTSLTALRYSRLAGYLAE